MLSSTASRLTGDITVAHRGGTSATIVLAGYIRARLEEDRCCLWWRDGLAVRMDGVAEPRLAVWRNGVASLAPGAEPGQTVKLGGVEIARDLDGDGHPDLLVASGAERWLAFTLAGRPRLLAEAKGRGEWRQFAGEPLPVFRTSAAGTEISLRYRGGRFPLDPDRMRRPRPDDAAIGRLVPEMSPDRLRQQMIEWVFAGNAGAAAHLFVAAWKGGGAAGEEFLESLRETLRASGYWEDLLEFNGPGGLLG